MEYQENSGGLRDGYAAGQRGSGDKDSILRTVDLFSGQLKLPVSLGYLEGMDGLGINIQIDYSPKEQEAFYCPTAEEQDSVLGFQWNFKLPCIVVGELKARQIYQKSFYLIGEGGRYPLYRKGSGKQGIEFYSVEHPFWKFFYSQEESSWTVQKTDQSSWNYGESSDSRGQSVCWDNWTGPSAMNGAQTFDTAWYLSSVTDGKGHRIAYSYENVKERLGDRAYTRTVRLKKIVSAYGEEAVFSYAAKLPEEYKPKHMQKGGENAYQEHYEDCYLQKMQVYNREHTLLYAQELDYLCIPSFKGEKRRLLSSITRVTGQGIRMEPLRFEYQKDGEAKQQLICADYPLASAISYEYETINLENYRGDQILLMEYGWDSTVYDGGDFYFILYSRDEHFKYQIYGWDMSFQELLFEPLSQARAENVKVHLGSGFVCVTWLDEAESCYMLRTITRNAVKWFDWDTLDIRLPDRSREPAVCTGKNYIACQCSESRQLKILQFEFTDSLWHEQELETENHEYQVLGAGETYFFAAYGDRDSGRVRLRSFYVDEKHQWISGDVSDLELSVDWELIRPEYVWAIGAAHGAVCFVSQRDRRVEASLVLLSWTDGFRFTSRETHTFSYDDTTENPLSFAVVTDTLVGYGENLFRYGPDGWHYRKLLNVRAGGCYRYSYGNDLALGVEKDGNRQRFYAIAFDPYNNDWSTLELPYSPDISQEEMCQPLTAGDYAVLGHTLFVRKPEGGFEEAGSLPEGIDYGRLEISGQGGYLLCQLLKEECILQIPLKDGRMSQEIKVCGDESMDLTKGRHGGYGSFYTRRSDRSGTGVHFYRLDGRNFKEKKELLVLKQIQCQNGAIAQDIFLQYDPQTIRLEGKRAGMQKVWVMPSSALGLYGKREYRYFNGASPRDFHYPEGDDTNVKDYYSSAYGQLYCDIEYNGDNQPVLSHEIWLWSMDQSGIHLLPRKLMETTYLPAAHVPELTAKGALVPVEKEVLFEYEDRFYQKRRTIRPGHNAQGEEIKLCEEITYAWEEYGELLNCGQIEAVARVVSKELVSQRVTAGERYVYEKSPAGFFYQSKELVWTGGEDVTLKDGWQLKRHIKEVTLNGNPKTEADEEGLLKTYIYDKKDQFITAQFDLAASGEAWYCGFEPYEDSSGMVLKSGNIEDAVTEEVKYSGSRSLLVQEPDKITVKIRENGTGLRVTFMVKAQDELHITRKTSMSSEEYTYHPAEAGWNRADLLMNREQGYTGISEIVINSKKPFYLDAVFLCPLLATGEAFVYSGDLMYQTACHKNYTRGSRTFYDSLGNAIACGGDDGVFQSVTRRRYGRREHMPVDEILSAELPKGGCLLDNVWQDTPYWQKVGSQWKFAKEEHFLLALWGKPKTLELGGLRLNREGNTWNVTWKGEGKAAACDGTQNRYLFLKMGKRVQFSCEDALIFESVLPFEGGEQLIMTQELNGGEQPAMTQELEGGKQPAMVQKQEGIVRIGFAPNPKITLSCVDFSQNPHQEQAVTETEVLVNQLLYNPLYHAEITTKKALFPEQLWGYRPGFVTEWNHKTGILKGEVAEQNPLDEGFAYYQIHNQNTLTPRPEEIGQAGRRFARSGDGNTLRISYMTNADELCGQKPYSCIIRKESGPDGHVLADVEDRFGQKILSVTGNENAVQRQLMEYVYDAAGEMIQTCFPNYFTEIKDKEKYISNYQYDAQQNLVYQKEPDAASVRTIYTKTGKQRFRQPDGGNQGYLYTLYDEFGRMTEEGFSDGPWQEEALKKAALDTKTPPPEAKASCRYFYDGDGCDGYLLNMLTCIEFYGADGSLETREQYWYDTRQNITRKDVTTGTMVQSLAMEYDEEGNMTSCRMGDEVIGYRYDVQSRLCSVSYQNEEIYRCSYLPEGGLLRECYLPEKDGEFIREYTYDSNLWLTGISDPFFSQELTYYTADKRSYNPKDTGLSGRITECVSRWNTDKGDAPQEIRYRYEYDEHARLKSYEKNGSRTTMYYDANGNQTGRDQERFSYEAGNNRLLSLPDDGLTYDAAGNVTGLSKEQMELSYDRVSGRIRSIKTSDMEAVYTCGSQGFSTRTIGGQRRYTMQDSKGRLFSESVNGERTLCIYGAGGIAAQVKNGRIYFFLRDYQSSVRAVCDGKNLLAAFAYDPLGVMETEEIYAQEVRGLIPLRFTASRFEEALGIYTMKYRLYCPALGRFLSMDPENQHTSPYLYGGADWVNYFDLDGAISNGASCALSILGGILCAALGAFLAIGTAGMGTGLGVALGLVGAGMIGTGIGMTTYGISAINGEFKAAELGIYAGMGFVTGFIGAGIGAGVSALAPTIGTLGAAILDIGTGIVVGGADSVISNGLINQVQNRDFWDNWSNTLAIGCAVGAVGGLLSGFSSALRNNKAFWGQKTSNSRFYLNKTGGHGRGNGMFGHLKIGTDAANGRVKFSHFVGNGAIHITPMNPVYSSSIRVNGVARGRFIQNGYAVNARFLGQRLNVFNPFGKNCTTYTIQRMAGGGINLPVWMRAPALVDSWMKYIGKWQ